MDYLLPGLGAKVILGYDIQNGLRRRWLPSTYVNTTVSDINADLTNENFTRLNPLLDFYLTYKRDLDENNRLALTAGYEYQDFYSEFPRWRAYNFSSDIFGPNSATLAADFEANNYIVENRLIGFFGRVNYSLFDRYVVTATLRRDGSTRFGPENRWGWFPSAALAWRILQENWADGLAGTFSDLKLRLSYGITGNQEIGDFRYLPTYSFSDVRALYPFGGAYVTTARPNAYDAGLKWEETSSFNAGLDFGFFGGRLTGTLDWYNKHTYDLLFTVNVPAGTNLSDRVLTNVGELENQGIELTLDARVLTRENFNWNVGFNAARNTNEVLAIDQVSTSGILTGGISGGVGNNIQILQVGQAVNAFYVFENLLDEGGSPRRDGIDYDEDGDTDLADMYADTNGDGIVNDLDKRPFHKPAPDWILGLTTNLNWGGFDLSMTMRSNIGNYVYNNNASNRGYLNYAAERGDIFMNNVHVSALETGFTTPQYFSDYYVEDASFLRMDNITLGYNFGSLIRRPGTSLRLYFTAQNPFVLTNYSGLDPELSSGIDNNPYPWSRTYIFGATLGL
jgi:TonB-linked SusC/RagA family outer membrane protein